MVLARHFERGNVYSSGNYYKYWGLIRFDELESTLNGMEVYDADLELYVNSVSNQTRIWVYGFNDLDGYWYEDSAKWNNFPTDIVPKYPSSSRSVTGPGWLSFDVTQITNSYVENWPNYGYVVSPTTLYSSSQYNYAAIGSRESANTAPQLTVRVLTGTPDLVINRVEISA